MANINTTYFGEKYNAGRQNFGFLAKNDGSRMKEKFRSTLMYCFTKKITDVINLIYIYTHVAPVRQHLLAWIQEVVLYFPPNMGERKCLVMIIGAKAAAEKEAQRRAHKDLAGERF